MRQYQELLRHILEKGVRKPTRTRSPTTRQYLDAISVFGYQTSFDLAEGFPLLTTKALSFPLIAGELLWFLSGESNIRPLIRQNNHIWTEWPLERFRQATGDQIGRAEFEARIAQDEDFARRWGSVGPMYGKQWRAWQASAGGLVDQISKVVDDIRLVVKDRRAAAARRLVVSSWNVGDISQMVLAPCHALFQFDVTEDRLSCHLYQRSADVFLGVPYNIASYALLTHLVAREANLHVGRFIHTFGDVHIYENHVEQVNLQLSRAPKRLPRLTIRPDAPGLFGIGVEHLAVEGYDPEPRIPAEVAI